MTFSADTTWLLGEYKRRKQKNAAYSLRAFGRAVQVSPGRLSEFFSGKRPVTPKMARKIAGRLGLEPPSPHAPELEQIQTDAFAAVADWQHFAILSLMETRDFRSDERWIARRLGISSIEARDAIARLLRTGLARREGRALRPSGQGVTTSHDVASSAIRRSHRQSLEQAIVALEEVAVELRDVTSVTMAIDPRRIPEAKLAIRDFRRRLMQLLETGVQSEVYNLNVQLVPLTRTKG